MSKFTDIIKAIFAADKLLHCFVCFFIAAVAGAIVAYAGIFGWLSAVIAFTIMWIASIAKETIDATSDWRDIVAGVIGGIVPLVLTVIKGLSQ